jgi:hypothetical protein
MHIMQFFIATNLVNIIIITQEYKTNQAISPGGLYQCDKQHYIIKRAQPLRVGHIQLQVGLMGAITIIASGFMFTDAVNKPFQAIGLSSPPAQVKCGWALKDSDNRGRAVAAFDDIMAADKAAGVLTMVAIAVAFAIIIIIITVVH